MADDRHPEWKLDQVWRDRITGASCELCAMVKDEYVVSREGYKVADLRISRWILCQNQYVKGYSVLVLNAHAIELFDLEDKARSEFAEDIATASKALHHALSPIKINLEMQGNIIPHLHCHIKPRFLTDRPGHARIFQNAGTHILADEEYQEMIGRLQNQIDY